MKKWRQWIAIMLMFAILYTLGANLASAKVLTAVNDRFLTYSSSTEPVRKNGEYYVPYSVFTSSFGISYSYSSESQVLTLSQNGASLTFSVSQGTAYDQDGRSFPYPPYALNGTIYVPVRLVCSKFSLMYSVIDADSTVLRIYNSAAVYSDVAFVSANADYITQSAQGGATSSTTTTTEEEPEVMYPVAISLTYLAEQEDLTLLLDGLAEQAATIFLPTDLNDAQAMRQLVGSGQQYGWQVTDQTTLEQLEQANAWAFVQTGTVSRMVYVDQDEIEQDDTQVDETAEIDQSIQTLTTDTLQENGYFCFVPSHITGDDTAIKEMQALESDFATSYQAVQILLTEDDTMLELTALLVKYAQEMQSELVQITLFSEVFLA